MLDGIKIYYRITDFEAWRRATNIEFFTSVDLKTGDTKVKLRTVKNGEIRKTITNRGNFETYQLTVKETTVTNFRGERFDSTFLIIDGSLHKNYFSGSNHLPFTWEDLQTEIRKFEASLQLPADLLELVNLEIGINIGMPFAVFPYLQSNLISFKGYSFNKYAPDKDGICLGYVCPLRQYSVKLYDKGKQFDLPRYLMRFELRYLKMQILKERGIKCLTDLLDKNRINGLLSLLLTAWDNLLFFDSSINLQQKEMKQSDRSLLKDGNNPKFWEALKEKSKRQFNYKRAKFRQLVRKYGTGWQDKIKQSIKSEWLNLFQTCPILPCVHKSGLDKSTVKINGNNVQNRNYKKERRFYDGQKREFLDAIKTEFSYAIKRRYCLSCGREISNQNERSKFCSAKFVGDVAAHRCRNQDSNPRNNFKVKMKRINVKGVLFDPGPYFITNNMTNKTAALSWDEKNHF